MLHSQCLSPVGGRGTWPHVSLDVRDLQLGQRQSAPETGRIAVVACGIAWGFKDYTLARPIPKSTAELGRNRVPGCRVTLRCEAADVVTHRPAKGPGLARVVVDPNVASGSAVGPSVHIVQEQSHAGDGGAG